MMTVTTMAMTMTMRMRRMRMRIVLYVLYDDEFENLVPFPYFPVHQSVHWVHQFSPRRWAASVAEESMSLSCESSTPRRLFSRELLLSFWGGGGTARGFGAGMEEEEEQEIGSESSLVGTGVESWRICCCGDDCGGGWRCRGFSWVRRCLTIQCFNVNLCWQMWHWKGLSPVWQRTWRLRSWSDQNLFGHTEQYSFLCM